MNFHMSKKQWAVVAVIAVGINVPFLIRALRPVQAVTAAVPFEDNFDRDSIGSNYVSFGGNWRIEDGKLHSPGVKNNPLWLNARLPQNVAVEFDVKTKTKNGDLKCEIFGNGWDHASGYVVIMGGWSNKISIIARLDEHGRDRKENRNLRVEPDRFYHFLIERRGGLIEWSVDGEKVLSFDDKKPLFGEGHDRFGFSSWDNDLYFDNLKIRPL